MSLRENVLASLDGRLEHGLVVLQPENAGLRPLTDAGLRVFVPSRRRRGRLDDIRHVQRAIRAFRPHILHTSVADADLTGRVAAFWERTPVLTSLINTPYGTEAAAAEPVHPFKLRLVWLADRLLAHYATTVFHAISRAAADHAMQHLSVPESKIRVVPRGRSRDALGERSDERRRSVREAFGWADRPLVINVARQEPQKGHVLLLEAMVEVLAAHPDALLVIVGRHGRSSAVIEERIARLGLSASVDRLGVRSDVADLVAAADVFAFSSVYEGLGGAVLEAAGLGVPVVSFDIPAVREVLGDAHPWLVPVGDTNALGRAILEVLKGGPHVDAVAEAERARFFENYELDISVAGMTRLYGDLADALERTPRSHVRRVPRLSVPW